MHFSQFIPPVIYSILRKFYSKSVARKKEELNIFSSFEEATSICGKYDDGELSDVVRIKTQNFLKANVGAVDTRQATQNLLVFQTVLNNSQYIDVIEIGGACGALFFFINTYFTERIKNWVILETPSMVKAGKKYFETPCLNFSSDLTDLSKKGLADRICIASGVVQYMPNPSSSLDFIFSNEFDYIYLTRQPVLTSYESPLITFQLTNLLDNGPGVLTNNKYNKKKKIPITYIPEKYFLDKIKQYGYAIIYNFEEQLDLTLNVNENLIQYKVMGLLLKKK
jgi:putative methyltransferase (TIGR04325 family)